MRRLRTAGTAICSSGDFSLQSQEGDPLGLLYFCLAVHDLLLLLQLPIVIGYLDDMSMGGEAGRVA